MDCTMQAELQSAVHAPSGTHVGSIGVIVPVAVVPPAALPGAVSVVLPAPPKPTRVAPVAAEFPPIATQVPAPPTPVTPPVESFGVEPPSSLPHATKASVTGAKTSRMAGLKYR